MNRHYKPVIMVTGCSSGIGLALARMLWAKEDYRVVITARQNSLDRFKNEPFHENDRFMIRALDVTVPEERQKIIEDISYKWGSVDVLVNNAGISYRAAVEHMDDESEIHQMNSNYFGPMGLVRLVLPHMRKKGRGKIINVSSVSGMLAMPTMGSYSASKYALEGASESLWYEMRPLGVNVTLIQPGFIHSNSFRNVYMSEASRSCDLKEGPYCDYYNYMAPFIEKMMNLSRSSPEKIARKIMEVIGKSNPPLRVPATIDALVFNLLRRFLPRWIFHEVLFFFLPGSAKWGRKYSRARRLR